MMWREKVLSGKRYVGPIFCLLYYMVFKSIIGVNASRIFWTGKYNKSYVFVIPFSFCAILIALKDFQINSSLIS